MCNCTGTSVCCICEGTLGPFTVTNSLSDSISKKALNSMTSLIKGCHRCHPDRLHCGLSEDNKAIVSSYVYRCDAVRSIGAARLGSGKHCTTPKPAVTHKSVLIDPCSYKGALEELEGLSTPSAAFAHFRSRW